MPKKTVKTFKFLILILAITTIHIAVFIVYNLSKNSNNDSAPIEQELKRLINPTDNNQKQDKRIASDIPVKEPIPLKKENTHTPPPKPQIYSWTDNSGIMHFSDKEPQTEVNNLQKKDAYVSDYIGSSEIEASRLDPDLSSSSRTRIRIRGNQILVPVRLGYKNREVQVMLLLDTGATGTLIHSEAASRLDLWKRYKSTSTVADGRTVDSEIAYLDYIKVGPHKIKNFQVTIINYSGKNEHHTGLLGMNFLRYVKYDINYSNQTITWR